MSGGNKIIIIIDPGYNSLQNCLKFPNFQYGHANNFLDSWGANIYMVEPEKVQEYWLPIYFVGQIFTPYIAREKKEGRCKRYKWVLLKKMGQATTLPNNINLNTN